DGAMVVHVQVTHFDAYTVPSLELRLEREEPLRAAGAEGQAPSPSGEESRHLRPDAGARARDQNRLPHHDPPPSATRCTEDLASQTIGSGAAEGSDMYSCRSMNTVHEPFDAGAEATFARLASGAGRREERPRRVL